MSLTLTEEQARAIGARGTVIVSASAGSGKTFVMIERLVELILAGADVRRTLAVTFTNKAANQMRERLRSALIKRVAESGEDERKRLKEQLAALPLADISTIHALCARLVRANFFLAGTEPTFRVVSPDDAEGKLLLSRALDETFEEQYAEKNPAFLKLLSVYFRGKKDAKLRGIVLSLYASVRGKADYRDLLGSIGGEDGFEEVAEYLAEQFRGKARFLAAKAEDMGVFLAENSPRGLGVAGDILAAANALLQGDLFEMAAIARTSPAIRSMPPSTRATGELLKQLKALSRLSAATKELYKDLGKLASREEERSRYLDGQSIARALASLVSRFDEIYSECKREAGVLDYDDLEHCALKVLSDDGARASVCGKYDYVFVDEYQDVNPAQERILSLLGGKEVFLVGDAKQSIYGFRGSRSEFFVKKCAEFRSLSLTENFRSAPAVLEAVNRVFAHAMTEESAGLAYAAAPMRGGKRYAGHDGLVRFHTVSATKAEKRERGIYSVLSEGRSRTDEQAELVADLIEEEVGSEWFDADAGLVKTLRYGDIAVLVRKGSGDAEKIIAALSGRDIPVTATAGVNVCDFWEARLIIDWLSFLDNGEQDIPLAGAMLSRVGGFTDAELAEIRLRFPSAYTFREACREYRTKMADGLSSKLAAFFARAEEYRSFLCVRPAAEMIGMLLSAGLEAEISAKRDGAARMRRIRRLCEEAKGSVNDFLRRLKTLSYRVEYAESGGDDAVKVLTMHASKGLEFPVVFLVSLEAPFRTNEREEVCFTDCFLFAPKSYDPERHLMYETVLRRASAVFDERESVKGELNLLYVAMTRAKYRLHMLFREKEGALAPQFAKRFSDFIDFDDCAAYFEDREGSSREPVPRSSFAYRPDEALVSAVRAAYGSPYPHAASVCLPVKSSATELMKGEDDGAHTGGGATVEEGLAYHAFLEHVRFGRPAAEELERMRAEKTIPEERLALLDAGRLEQILALPSLRAAGRKRIFREQTFLVSLPASALPSLNTAAEDEIVIQGAIDLLAIDEEGYLILDYKYSGRNAKELKEHYAPQLSLYKKAVAKIAGVDECTIRARIVNLLKLFEVEM